MPNDQVHDTRVTDPLLRLAAPVQASVAAVASGGGGGDPVAGFTAEAGFNLTDNGDGTYKITDAQSRFGTKPNAALPVWYFDFGSGSDQPHPTLSRQQKTVLWSSQCSLTQAVVKAGATHSMTIDTELADNGESVFGGLEENLDADKTLQLPVNAGRKYFRYYDVYNDFLQGELDASVRANTISSFVNFKTHRWQSENAQTTPYTGTVIQGYEYKFNWWNNVVDIGEFYDYRTQLATKAWIAEEEYHQVSSAAGATDATVTGVINGQQRFNLTGLDSHDGLDPSSAANRWGHYKLGNFRYWAAPGDAPWRANILYVDDSWCRVYITDKPTWTTSETKALELQIPTAWLSGELDFHFRQGAHASLTGKYLWVVDNDDTKILVGSW